MKKLTHSESEIVKSVNELEAGVSADEICRRLNVSRATLYQWKRKYGGLASSVDLLNVIDDSDRVAVAQNHLGERQPEQRSLRQRPMDSFRMNFKIGAMETESKF